MKNRNRNLKRRLAGLSLGLLLLLPSCIRKDGKETELEAEGNGTLSAINNALCAFTGEQYTLQVFTQHSMQGQGSRSVAASYIGLERADGTLFWGAGTDTDVVKASTNALLSAFQNMTKGGVQ